MRWISNGDPPLYVWPGDTWYNQKDKMIYKANINERSWISTVGHIDFPKKTRIMELKDE